MVRIAICCVAIALFAAAIAGPVCAGVAGRYEVVELVSDGTNSTTGITNSGIICKYGRDIAGNPGLIRYNMNTGVTEFTDQISTFEDINNAGTVVGFYNTRSGVKQYCVWNTDGTITDLPPVPAYTAIYARINDAGQVLGQGYGDFVWTAESGSKDPIVPTSYESWDIRDINNSGSYLGRAWAGWEPASGSSTGLVLLQPQYMNAIWSDDGSYCEIGKSKANWTYLNDKNQVAGTEPVDGRSSHVVFWDAEKGKVDATAGMAGSFTCLGLNNAGQMLIDSSPQFSTLPGGGILLALPGEYIWDAESGMRSVQDLLGPASGWYISNCSAINDQGWITAYGFRSPGYLSGGVAFYSGTVVLRPVTTPEPSSVIAFMVGFVGLAGVAKGRGGKIW